MGTDSEAAFSSEAKAMSGPPDVRDTARQFVDRTSTGSKLPFHLQLAQAYAAAVLRALGQEFPHSAMTGLMNYHQETHCIQCRAETWASQLDER